MKYRMVKITKRALIAVLVILALFTSVAGYQYLTVALAPEYNPETMPLNYEVMGSGERKIVLIHGLAGSKNYWRRDLEKISGTYRLLLVDLLGFGDSPKPQSEYTLQIQLAALENIISKEGFHRGESLIVGHSLGAVLSLALFAKHPDWFKGATVIGLPFFESKGQFLEQMSSDSFFDKLAVGRYGKLFCMLHPLYIVKWFKPKNLTDDVFKDSKKHTWQSYYNSLNEVILKTDLFTLTKNIRDRKILFIQGTNDKVAPFVNVEKFTRSFNQAKLIEVQDGDHQLFLKEPFEVWKAIGDFFDEKS
ncbi:alpha/beta hydrolase [uncultured Maribacter sp.]|uniref:alpha/beta fold hydrolase n=1 Tax=uncultured Maribacter sp. TaxID=431308 RepID=UPI0030ED1E85